MMLFMKNIEFTKMHGLGNDFVVIDARDQVIENKEKLSIKLADRHFGIGCDQVIIIEHSTVADVFMRILNPDGTESGACGNATRCVAARIMAEKESLSCSIETRRGVLSCVRAENDLVTVDMGEPLLEWNQIPVARETGTLYMPISPDAGQFSERLPTGVNMGNPHCVFFVDRLADINIQELGSRYECDPFFPERSNVEFVEVIDREHVQMRVWERGAGITLACGSGACATAVAAIRRGLTERKLTVSMDGGDLMLEWRESNNHVYMTGPVAVVFRGTWNI